ncbi:MAG: killer suppression protein HigA [Chamaesiphon sp. CSU_1_12]|nr:killer suppression protein HigA [Chamaesiphon sp. CSU_1_12]
MEITFGDSKLQELCEQEKIAQKKLGQPCARKLKARLANLMAAEVVTDIVAGRPHPLKGDRLGQFALDLEGGRRLVFESANEPIPVNEDGGIDWSQVTEIKIVFIGDYHD